MARSIPVDRNVSRIDVSCFDVWCYFLEDLSRVPGLPSDVAQQAQQISEHLQGQLTKPPEVSAVIVKIIVHLCIAVAAEGIAVLVFLPGIAEIEQVNEALNDHMSTLELACRCRAREAASHCTVTRLNKPKPSCGASRRKNNHLTL